MNELTPPFFFLLSVSLWLIFLPPDFPLSLSCREISPAQTTRSTTGSSARAAKPWRRDAEPLRTRIKWSKEALGSGVYFQGDIDCFFILFFIFLC